jgi:large subunit ribosomal protein L13
MKTISPTAPPLDARQWYVVDAADQTLGRLASNIAGILRGKHRRDYSPHLDQGDFVVVINAQKVRATGKKLTDKVYYRHSGYPGGIRSETLKEMLARKPERVVELAVRGMLPDNRLGDSIYKKLKVYRGPEHPHQAQQPVPLDQAAGHRTRVGGPKTR